MHETLRLSTRRRNRPRVSALGRVRLTGLLLDRLFFVLLGSDVEIVVKPRPGQRAERGAGRLRPVPETQVTLSTRRDLLQGLGRLTGVLSGRDDGRRVDGAIRALPRGAGICSDFVPDPITFCARPASL